MAEKILFFFSLIGVFNACLLAIYSAAFKPNRQFSDLLLSLLLILFVVRVGVSCFHFFGAVSPEAIKFGLIANVLIGPISFYLLQSLFHQKENRINSLTVHLLIWITILTISWFVFDFQVWNWYLRYILHGSLTVYLLTIAFKWRKELVSIVSSTNLSDHNRKAAIIYLSIILICVGFAISLLGSYIIGPLAFSLIFSIVLGYYLLNDKKEKRRASNQQLDQQEFIELNKKLVAAMETEKLYRNPDLSLELLATKLSIGRHLLSWVLNDKLKKNFHQYVNEYRIQEACDMLRKNGHYSIEAIGYEVGFHSRSSFFASFKKHMGITPSKFRSEPSPD